MKKQGGGRVRLTDGCRSHLLVCPLRSGRFLISGNIGEPVNGRSGQSANMANPQIWLIPNMANPWTHWWTDSVPLLHQATFPRLLLALILGACVGAELQWRQRAAGLRTNTLVCFGAAAFVDLGSTIAPGTTQVIAYVVSGVGFLGAGRHHEGRRQRSRTEYRGHALVFGGGGRMRRSGRDARHHLRLSIIDCDQPAAASDLPLY
jgi:MgtC family